MNSANLLSQSQVVDTDSIKLLVFSIGNLNAALTIDIVQKVVNYSTILSSGLNYYGLVNLGDQEVTVVDLHHKLFKTPQILNAEDKKYLLLARNSVNETFGILIKQSPELYDIKLNIIRALPSSYRRADTLKVASHVFVIKQEDEEEQEQEQEEKTIFILDPDQLVTST